MKISKLSVLSFALLGSVFAVNANADISPPCESLAVTIHNTTQMSLPLTVTSNNTNNAACPTLQTVLNPNMSSNPIVVNPKASQCDYTIIPQKSQDSKYSNQVVDATPLTVTIFCQANSAGAVVQGSNFDIAGQVAPNQVTIADND